MKSTSEWLGYQHQCSVTRESMHSLHRRLTGGGVGGGRLGICDAPRAATGAVASSTQRQAGADRQTVRQENRRAAQDNTHIQQ